MKHPNTIEIGYVLMPSTTSSLVATAPMILEESSDHADDAILSCNNSSNSEG